VVSAGPRETLAAAEEAVGLWRDLAAANPAHRPSLAMALTGLGAGLNDLGRPREALAAAEEAVGLWRDLAANPAHQPSLATALNSLGTGLRGLGRRREALAADQEALEVYCMLASADPDLHGETYRRVLAQLRRTYDLTGDFETGVNLHLPRPRQPRHGPPADLPAEPAGDGRPPA
jgi:tetratricopeptide (TPR) repeat protein